MGSYDCDDGNLIDGDGCDHNCKKEENAICKTVNLLNQCIIPSYNISFLEGMYKVKVAFNYEVANLSDYVANMKVKIRDINGAEILVPIISAAELNSTTLELQLYLDNISTSETDQLKLEFPGIPSYAYGTESIGTNEISTPAMVIPKSSRAIGSHVLMYELNSG
jgi:cysteine-rich repeat protein